MKNKKVIKIILLLIYFPFGWLALLFPKSFPNVWREIN